MIFFRSVQNTFLDFIMYTSVLTESTDSCYMDKGSSSLIFSDKRYVISYVANLI